MVLPGKCHVLGKYSKYALIYLKKIFPTSYAKWWVKLPQRDDCVIHVFAKACFFSSNSSIFQVNQGLWHLWHLPLLHCFDGLFHMISAMLHTCGEKIVKDSFLWCSEKTHTSLKFSFDFSLWSDNRLESFAFLSLCRRETIDPNVL